MNALNLLPYYDYLFDCLMNALFDDDRSSCNAATNKIFANLGDIFLLHTD